MSHSKEILNHLENGNKITALEALNLFGCFRLGARIYDLKKLGHEIESDMIKIPSGKMVAEYSLKV